MRQVIEKLKFDYTKLKFQIERGRIYLDSLKEEIDPDPFVEDTIDAQDRRQREDKAFLDELEDAIEILQEHVDG